MLITFFLTFDLSTGFHVECALDCSLKLPSNVSEISYKREKNKIKLFNISNSEKRENRQSQEKNSNGNGNEREKFVNV
jgi:hypothetical protein